MLNSATAAIETAATMPPPGRDTAATALPHCRHAARKRPRKPEPRRGLLLVLPSARTGTGKRLREFRASLVEHCAGRPSATQLVLIDRATVLQLHLTELDRKAAAAGGLSDHSTKVYLAWHGCLTRTLAQLGMKGAPPPVTTLAQHLAQRHAQTGAP